MPFTKSSSLSTSVRDSLLASSAGTRSAFTISAGRSRRYCAARELVGDGLPERNAAAAVLDDDVGQVGVRQAEAQVRLVVAVLAHRLLERHLREAARSGRAPSGRRRATSFQTRKTSPSIARKTSSWFDEAHLDVDLRELGLPVEAERLVAEALHDLEVLVEARDHVELLEELRALGQRVELARRSCATGRGSCARRPACT